MSYFAGFVAPVPAANRQVYLDSARESVGLFHRLGASRLVEAWGDDVPRGKQTDFWRSVAAEAGEEVVFAYHEYADKAAFDAANAEMMADPAMAEVQMPFDASRMIYGGFQSVLDEGGAGSVGFVDGALAPVPENRRVAYVEAARRQAPVFIEHGAERVVEAWGDFLQRGEKTDFYRAVDAREGEAVVMSFVEWPSREVRDAAWPKIFEDARMAPMGFVDEKRRVWGGFVPILDDRG